MIEQEDNETKELVIVVDDDEDEDELTSSDDDDVVIDLDDTDDDDDDDSEIKVLDGCCDVFDVAFYSSRRRCRRCMTPPPMAPVKKRTYCGQ